MPTPTAVLLLALTLPIPGLASSLEPSHRSGSSPAAGREAAPGKPALPEVLEGGRQGSRRLVLVLHGGSYRPRTPRELAQGALEPLDDAARQLGLRVVAPMVPDEWLRWSRGGPAAGHGLGLDASTVWASPQGEELLLAFLEHEIRRKRADPRRIYLAGHGAGATAALHLAARHPERFAAVALWSGTPSPEWAWPGSGNGSGNGSGHDGGTTPSTGSQAASGAVRVVGLVGEPVPRLEHVAVYLWTGQQDGILDREALTFFVRRMREYEQRDLGHELLWETGPGGHDYGPQGARGGLVFLKKHRKAKSR